MIVGIVLTCVLSGCRKDCRYCTCLCPVGLSWLLSVYIILTLCSVGLLWRLSVCIMLTCVLSGCHGDCRYLLYLLVFCRVIMVIVGMYCTYLCSLGLSW